MIDSEMSQEQLEQRQLEQRIETAATSLLSDDEICVSLDITAECLQENYAIVEAARLKLRSRLNARRVLAASETGDADQILREIPTNDYRRKRPRQGVKQVEGQIIGRGENQTVVPPEEVYKLAKLGCTLEEISEWFEVPRETLKYNFRDLIAKARAETKQQLRRAQIKVALGGNTSMLIWLGKNMLGQSDNPAAADADQILPWTDE